MIKEKLIQFESTLNKLGVQSVDYLNPPISVEMIEPQLGKLYPGIGNVDIIKDLYCWHNGTNLNYVDSTENFKITPLFFFNSIDAILEIIGEENDTLEFRSRKQIPLFSTGHGEFLSINFNDLINDPQTAVLYYVSTWSAEYELYTSMYDNVYSFLDTILTCLNEKIYFVNEDGFLDLDFEKEIEVAHNLNKRARYWVV